MMATTITEEAQLVSPVSALASLALITPCASLATLLKIEY